MRRKSKQVIEFIEGLHEFITSSNQYRENTKGLSEVRIQAEIRPMIIRYLELQFPKLKSPVKKTNATIILEWEQEKEEKDRTAI